MSKNTKTLVGIIVVVVIAIAAYFGFTHTGSQTSSDKSIKDLKIYFVPSKQPDQIVTMTKPMKGLLTKELKKEGYDVKNVDIKVGTSYEAAGEALSSGTADVGFIPGGTYVMYQDSVKPLLTATRAGLNKNFSDAAKWNNGKATEATTTQSSKYRSLFIAGPSEKGQALAKKINSGEKLTWEDLNSAKWGLSSTTSSAGYIYPSLWLNKNYKKTVADLKNTVTVDSYGSGMARLASGQIDIMPTYADARRDFASAWTTDYKQPKSIWAETNVIGVSQEIYNDTISVSKKSKTMTPELEKALSKAFINLAKTKEGKKVIAIYSHEGYEPAKSSNYDGERAAQKVLKDSQK
ncbi:MAG: PhnD/SsuA/transferrin family substrate-binding protein [Leuconostoc gelidum]|jgi:phosphonate transport system substrate-binding protein|uniref:PhnD/SsuA/transferrin family substrate-binding protein n=1 Tax=Leuconostoc gelidum subsp. gelidum TaxID=1607839 RepID=A0AB35FXA4_LEUGE|nr:PhnD/SsuA/transferrin family substrate-binding protein [Leuconostoc gelidum]AFS41122.1 phosphonate ABC transporter phosphonate-binding protein [Leuconostoc gelidum JB7]MBZ5963960.1 PhnD/SsuA/transferrin family substrate-binding protein [Leuconostoc gelidum subsp. gelidum]MBZ5974299.1 PhnD/SsuA/transferrin family substrate-binding protein [Leuconostoc gelidum subsp. gelidum]MBZ5975992.1 PhnD/SsuA/transferrin family substrate-binding protein [Leuconostoc gelidum subsp. gelidum]MBZ5978814.1 Ph